MVKLVTDFCRQVRARSAENQAALAMLLQSHLLGIAVGLLRLELDSLIRVAYLSKQGASSQISRSLMEDSVNGDQWTTEKTNGKFRRITDREMIDLARHLGGWVNFIYSFGCKLIHLSDIHDYKVSDPFTKLENADRLEIVKYLHDCHQYPDPDIDQPRFEAYLPKVMQKLVDNVAFYVAEIESANTL
ncbi:MAG: hypothetical protein RM347_032645 [Nostoc sp. ChiQUE02]|uniref:hypothetical protein n=1 Tax=Nostoc sp. ChiQUE02 TaxID=3075377 RepID=UPI002AD356BA|nr:hypothetical protein [Nostoc sp. ChiQUE02]MDZ8228912.1 hypothetical protein [Nostoc sp. ChiQUE02]